MKKENLTPWLLLSPCLLIMGSTVFYPAVRTFLFSMQRYRLTESYDIRFIGLDNYPVSYTHLTLPTTSRV